MNGPLMTGQYTWKTTISAAAMPAAYGQSLRRGASALLVLLLFILALQLKFHDCEPLRHRDVRVLQIGDDHGEPVEHDQKDAEHQNDQCERRIGQAQLFRDPVQ